MSVHQNNGGQKHTLSNLVRVVGCGLSMHGPQLRPLRCAVRGGGRARGDGLLAGQAAPGSGPLPALSALPRLLRAAWRPSATRRSLAMTALASTRRSTHSAGVPQRP